MSHLLKNIQLKKINVKRYAIDVRGFACPYPQIMVMAALEELKSEDVLEVTLDNPPSVRDVPVALKDRGFNILDVSKIDNLTWKIIVQHTRQ
jgi:tRNA 2-thiouridine synthesizing protein A